MHLDVQDLRNFYYRSTLGRAAQLSLRLQLTNYWPEAKAQTVVGFGFAVPLLRPYLRDARRVAALMPGRLIGVAVLSVAIGGWMIGALSVPDPGPLRDLLFTLSGSVVGANLGPLYIFGIRQAIQERFTQPWVAIAFRVAAAWLGAISLVMLALQMAAPPVA